MKNDYSNSAQTARVGIPLVHLRAAAGLEGALMAGMRLERATEVERDMIALNLEWPHFFDGDTVRALRSARWLLVANAGPTGTSVDWSGLRRADVVIRALRLLHSGDVAAPIYFVWDASNHRPVSSGGRLDRIIQPAEGAYELSALDISNADQLVRQLEHPNVAGSLQTALTYLEQSYSRSSIEDRLIDLAIALESSLLFGIRDELRYRLALRGAALLGPIRDPERTYTLLKLSYDMRSKVVHEGKRLSDSELQKEITKALSGDDSASPAESLLEELYGVVRDVLREYVERLASAEAARAADPLGRANRELDSSILRSLASSRQR